MLQLHPSGHRRNSARWSLPEQRENRAGGADPLRPDTSGDGFNNLARAYRQVVAALGLSGALLLASGCGGSGASPAATPPDAAADSETVGDTGIASSVGADLLRPGASLTTPSVASGAAPAFKFIAGITRDAANTATLSWDRPTTNADGSPLTDLASFRVYQGSEQQLSKVLELTDTGAGRREVQLPNAGAGNHCFAVTAADASGNESVLSSVMCRSLDAPPPSDASQRPVILDLTELGRDASGATIRVRWTPADRDRNVAIVGHSAYQGSAEQLFKVAQIGEAATVNEPRSTDLTGLASGQACFAVSTIYADGFETALSAIVCLTISAPPAPPPGDDSGDAPLRPYDVAATRDGADVIVSWRAPARIQAGGDALPVAGFDLFQGSPQQLVKVDQLDLTVLTGDRGSVTVATVANQQGCFALTAFDANFRFSALSEISCAPAADSGSPSGPAPSDALAIDEFAVSADGDAAAMLNWSEPAGRSGVPLAGYNIYQGSEAQLFKVQEVAHAAGAAQNATIDNVPVDEACFALTAYDETYTEGPLSTIRCIDATLAAPERLPQPLGLRTVAIGGGSQVEFAWQAVDDPRVDSYNVYQGTVNRLNKVRQLAEPTEAASTRRAVVFDAVTAETNCFAVTAQTLTNIDLESPLSEVICHQ
ncbi:MAG: hypothetical protein AAF515_04295 [Pseudomonadota bacterium]